MKTVDTGLQEGEFYIRSLDTLTHCIIKLLSLVKYQVMRLVYIMCVQTEYTAIEFQHEMFSEFLFLHRHIIGKDIIWFHCVIWPCILMSAGVTLPVGVFSHGFVNAADGRKMSKSYNNAIDPHEV